MIRAGLAHGSRFFICLHPPHPRAEAIFGFANHRRLSHLAAVRQLLMKITLYTGGITETNGYLVESPDGNFLVDAPQGIADWLAQRGTRVDDLLLTHQHYDHVLDAAAIQQTGARLHAFAAYSPDLTLEAAARAWGMPISVEPYQIDLLLDTGRPLLLAGREIALAHIPGHATDAVTFHLADEGIVFSGDTLFAGSIGRTDLPGGSTRQLLEGIARHLMILPPATRVLSGHGPATTIGREAAANPYLE
jgi:glyoxylase-like metal-dependent hydrolase (beta-lactamase superfamily II)